MTSTTKSPVGKAPSTTDRRVRRTQRALREAFVSLVLEHGYEGVTVEDITERADVARATFYAHFDDKEQLLGTLFEELTSELVARLDVVAGVPQEGIRAEILTSLYQHAAEYRDLYLVCLRGAGNGRARAAYMDIITRAAEQTFVERVRTSGLHPPVDLALTSRAFAGTHLALLEAWLDDDGGRDAEQMARTQLELGAYGWAWALGMLPANVIAAMPKLREPDAVSA